MQTSYSTLLLLTWDKFLLEVTIRANQGESKAKKNVLRKHSKSPVNDTGNGNFVFQLHILTRSQNLKFSIYE